MTEEQLQGFSDAVKRAVEAAYREGWADGVTWPTLAPSTIRREADRAWTASTTRGMFAALDTLLARGAANGR